MTPSERLTRLGLFLPKAWGSVRDAAVCVCEVNAISHEATSLHELPIRIDRWYMMLRCWFDDQHAVQEAR
jgi:hypothetical protein